TEVSRAEMLATVERTRPIATRVDPPRGVGFDAMWADVGARTMAAGTGDGKITVWSLRGTVPDRASARTFDIGRTPLAMASQAGTGLLAVGGGDGSAEAGGFPGRAGAAYLIDVRGPIPPRPAALPLTGDSPVSALAFAGNDLFAGRWDGTILVV